MRQDNFRQPDGQKLGWFIFECVMAVLYLLFGFLFLFSSLFDNIIQGGLRIALGIVLGLYGIFRIFRAIKKIVQKNN
ncbi:MAG: hypothetical protein LIO93_07570 [Bacteroidales bacterium]|nr:hypothetical protein [Bacteroidales bacterium]